MKTPTLLYLLLLILATGCYNHKAELLYPVGACNTDSVTYSGTVHNILKENCALSNCHDAATAMNGVELESLSGAQTVALDGRLLGVINHATGFSAMPKDKPMLDACTIQRISKWVAAGAPNN